MARLRAPDGCPWDREQTFDSIKPYTLEETYEVLEAIDARDWNEQKKRSTSPSTTFSTAFPISWLTGILMSLVT